jgi:hypothetical protein
MTDLTNRKWIITKGLLFAVIVLLSGTGVILYEDFWREFPSLVICLWAACRFYYFLFYVLERYVGLGGRYAGIMDLARRLWHRNH